MNIVYFISYPHRMAGANRSLWELVKNLPADCRATVVCVEDGPVADAYRRIGVRVQILSPGGRLLEYGKAALGWSMVERVRRFTIDVIPYWRRIRQLLRLVEADVLHTNDLRGTLLAGPAGRLAGIPVISHLRGEIPFGKTIRFVYESIPTRIIAVSEATRTDLSQRARERTTAVYNGTTDISTAHTVDVQWLDFLRRSGIVVISVFASVVPFKGHHHILKATELLNGRGYRDRFVIVCVGDLDGGYPEYVEWLLNMRSLSNVDNLMFAGWQDSPFAFYRSSDVSVLPSVSEETLTYAGRRHRVFGNEGFPRTHLEAMCFGLPIVGTDIAGVREQVVDGETGFVVPPGDAVALADALEQLILDSSLRRRMGSAGRERVLSRFSTRAYVEGVLNVYESVVQGL